MQDRTIIHCDRCGVACKQENTTNEEARLLKHAIKPETQGYCADCAVTDFMKNRSQLAMLLSLNPAGKEMLLDTRVQAQFASVLQAGNADASPMEINWQRVYNNWDKPFPAKQKGQRRRK